MVDFTLDEETRLVLDSFETFLDTEVGPIEEALGETFANPRKRRQVDGRPVEEVVEAVREIRQLSADAGFYAMTMPTEVGGEGMSLVTWYEAKKAAAAHESELAGRALSGPEGPKPLLLNADADQRERYVEPVVRGEKSTAFAQTEPGAGSDSPNMTTTARRDGDEWVIDGTKQWITNAPFCDFAQVFARTTPAEDAGRYGGITCFIVERDEFELGAINNAIGVGGWRRRFVSIMFVSLPTASSVTSAARSTTRWSSYRSGVSNSARRPSDTPKNFSRPDSSRRRLAKRSVVPSVRSNRCRQNWREVAPTRMRRTPLVSAVRGAWRTTKT